MLPNPKDPSIPPAIRWSSLKVIGNDTIVGSRCMDVWAKGREIYFFMKFSKPFERAEVYSSGRLQSAAGEVRGTALRCVLNLKTGEDEIVYVKTGGLRRQHRWREGQSRSGDSSLGLRAGSRGSARCLAARVGAHRNYV